MGETFNSEYYVTAATVIPVMLLALTLQGTTLETLFKSAKDADPDRENAVRKGGYPWFRSLFSFYVPLFFTAVIICAVIAEILSLTCLHSRSDSSTTGVFVLISMCLLFAIFGLAILIKYFRMFGKNYIFLIGMPDTWEPPEKSKRRLFGRNTVENGDECAED